MRRDCARNSPIFIADAAVYLMYHQPELGIQNPYALDETQLAAAVDLRAFARLRLSRLRKRARRRAAAAATLEPTRLHALRIAFKLLRYGVEFFAPLFPARTVNRYLDGVVQAQTALGFLQDVDIAHQRLSEWSRAPSTT